MNNLGKVSANRLKIGEEESGQRLDNFLLRVCKGVPKSHIYRILRSGEVRVNSCRARPDQRLAEGDEVRIPPLRVAERPKAVVPQRTPEFPALFEDAALLVVNKPAGVAVHGGSGVSYGVIEALRQQRPEARFLELAHRLDRETSGALLIGKKRSALNALHDVFRQGRADKRYLVLVRGAWRDALRHARQPLLKYENADGERRVSVNEEGKPAHTIFRLVARWENFSLLEAELKTGRTHQIRVHLAHLGYPICGDDKYGDFALNKSLEKAGLKRMFLHAWKITLPHPASGERLCVEAPLPDELRDFVASLDANEQCTQDKRESWKNALN